MLHVHMLRAEDSNSITCEGFLFSRDLYRSKSYLLFVRSVIPLRRDLQTDDII